MHSLLHDVINLVIVRNADLPTYMSPSLHDLVKHRKVYGTIERQPVRSQDEVVVFAEPVAIDLFVCSAETHVDMRQVANHEVQATCDRVVFRGSSEREVSAVLFLQKTCSL